jgi:predicted ferric reductase
MIRRSRLAALVGLDVFLALVPLAIALAPARPAGRGFWIELSLAVGFAGLGQTALQFGLIARFARLSRPLGIDLVMRLHRQLGLVAALLAVAHLLLLAVARPATLRLLDPTAGDAASRTGVFALVALVLLLALSYGRRALRLGYEAWRVSHALLGIAAVALTLAHVLLAGRYLAAPWKQAALVAWCLALVGLVLFLRLVKPALLARRPWRVAEVRPEAAETWSLSLEPEGHPGMRFAPGQFAWLKVDRSPWSVREHPFSFSSSAERPGRLEMGIKELGDFTRTVGRLAPGTRAYLDGPHGSFSIDLQPAPGYLFIAGGIGVSPVLSMLRTLADRGDRRPHALLYACSRWDRVAYREEIEELAERLDLEVVLVLEEPPEGWAGPRGYLNREVVEPRLVAANGAARDVFLCGPLAMMTALEEILIDECGVAEERVHGERFQMV